MNGLMLVIGITILHSKSSIGVCMAHVEILNYLVFYLSYFDM